jgi:hypothetical protein
VTATHSYTVDDNMTSHEEPVHPTSKLSFLKFNSSLSPQHPLRFIALSAQVCFYYLIFGYLQVRFLCRKEKRFVSIFIQELIFTLEGFRKTAWLLTCYQFFIYGFLAFIQLGFSGLSQRRLCKNFQFIFSKNFLISRASYRSYVLLASLSVGTMGLSNYSVGYLNYPYKNFFFHSYYLFFV